MNKTLLGCALLLPLSGILDRAAADDADDVRAAVEKYVEAFNQGDAAALAAIWSEDGVWVSPGGDRISGRDAIQTEMEAYFNDGAARLEVISPQIRIVAPTVAIEEGEARVTQVGQVPSTSSYIAIHVKGDDGWKLESVRETVVPHTSSSYDHLRDLDWMVGTWIDQQGGTTIETTCQWTKNRNFLTRSFRSHVSGKLDLEGTQVIGYDASKGQIRSWIFDSAGGFGEGRWTRDGDRWVVTNSQTLQDGAKASSINVITLIDEDTCTWSSHGRELDGELLPGIEPVTITRVTTNSATEGTATDATEEATSK